jgi:hypothetical protein
MRRAVTLLALVAPAAACTYDWPVGPSPGADAGVDATAGDAAAEEASPPFDATSVDAPRIDAPPPPPFSCAEAGAALPGLLANAKSCKTQPQECNPSAQDECGCVQIVAENNTARLDYVNAVAAFLDAGCTPSCPGCPTTQRMGLCVVSDGGFACVQ